MESISKEHVISGLIGGVSALALAFVARKAIWKYKRGCCGPRAGKCGPKGGKFGQRNPAEVITMQSENMPPAIGPYCKGKLVKLPDGSLMAYSSGQLGLDPKTGELISEDVAEQAEQIIKNLKSLAEDNGMTLNDTVKNVVYLTDMADFGKVNAVYTKYYGGEGKEYPARTCIAIKALPKGGLVEFESVFFKACSGEPGCC